ncbi:MAG TPA: diaminopimelate decarboxylase [Polyangiaceae bacterium]|nr:diaminopimelate decarboxylase [Polyangiaceae bacterium]
MPGPLSSAAPRLAPRWFDVLRALEEAGAGTPAYVYDLDAMQRDASAVVAAFGARAGNVFYAVKANSAGPIVRAIVAASARACGADVVTGAELLLALRCGIDPDRVVYSGVAKADEELDAAIGCGERGIRAIQAESIEELPRIDARARAAGRVARVALRINPGVSFEELGTHAHVATGHDEAKFGIAKDDLGFALAEVDAAKNIALCGLSSHVGSQFFRVDPYVTAARILCGIAKGVRASRPLEFLDTGGGFGVDYTGQSPAAPAADFVRAALEVMRQEGQDDLALHVEPGRCLVAAHGVLVARVIQRKVSRARPQDRWLMIDAGMNDLIRPALYQAKHRVVPLGMPEAAAPLSPWRVVGPVCESADDFGEHLLPDGGFDHVALLDAGAYGYTMASRYNGRALAAEVFVSGGRVVGSVARRAMGEWADERAGVG